MEWSVESRPVVWPPLLFEAVGTHLHTIAVGPHDQLNTTLCQHAPPIPVSELSPSAAMSMGTEPSGLDPCHLPHARSSLLQKLDTDGSVRSRCSYSSFGERRVPFKDPVAEMQTGNGALAVGCRVLRLFCFV